MKIIDVIRPHLFAHVGEDLPPGRPWRRFGAWGDARAEPLATHWGNVQIELSNELGALVQAESWAEYNRWNDIVVALKAEQSELFAEIALRNPAPPEHRTWLASTVRWDLLLLGVAEVYGRLQLVSRYPEILETYLAGRIPCGTVESEPDGALLVF